MAAAREAGPQGIFELRLKKFHPASASDECATLSENGGAADCRTKFRVCLKHFMAQVDNTSTSVCTFGEEVLTSEGRFDQSLLRLPPVKFDIAFKWPVSNISL